MRFPSVLAVLVFLLPAAPALGGSLNLNLSDDAFRAQVAQTITDTGLEIEGGWLHETDNGNVLDLGLHLVDDASPGRGALDVGVGAKVFHVDFDRFNGDGTALGIGGKFHYTWPTFNRFAVGGQLYHAPSVTSGGDIDRYTEAGVRAEYLILRNASAYVGVRSIRVGVDGDRTRTFESGPHLGIRLDF